MLGSQLGWIINRASLSLSSPPVSYAESLVCLEIARDEATTSNHAIPRWLPFFSTIISSQIPST